MFGSLNRFVPMGSPDQRMRVYPTQGDLVMHFDNEEDEFMFEMTTSEIVDLLKSRVATGGPKRLVLFSCGDLAMYTPEDVAVNETLKRIADLRKSYSVHLASDALYRRHIYRIGEGLFELFGSLPASFSLASMPAPTASVHRGTRGTRGTRKSQGIRRGTKTRRLHRKN